ncbi:DUF2252 family protein, partial [Nocardia wallacei]|uniref:DUF2252 family protein n=1 Tax=Nocardia wallacei TaxID=480035 RepID=UPI002457EECB
MVNSAVREAQKTSAEEGKAARQRLTRTQAGRWQPDTGRADPVAVLEQQARTRLPLLVPIRYARMMQSPFAFLRGAPAVMAADLAQSANTGLRVQLCGDAHIANFGLYASPERNLVFDLNDFDETLPGPFEWDVKRLAASVAVAAHDGGCSDQQTGDAVRAAAAADREAKHHQAPRGSRAGWFPVAPPPPVVRLRGAGHQPTVNLIPTAFLALRRTPRLLTELREHPE